MLKLKRPLAILVIFLIFVFLIVFGLATYLLASGVRVKYDGGQKRYLLDVSKNEFVKSLSLKYFKNLVSAGEKADGASNATNVNVEEAPVISPEKMAPEVVEKFKSDPTGMYFFRIGWGVDKVRATDSWDYTKSAFIAEVISYNGLTKKLSLRITAPNSMPYVGQLVSLKINCDPEKSYIEKDGMTTSPVNDPTLHLSSGTVLFTGQCSDERCSEIGPFCKVSVK